MTRSYLNSSRLDLLQRQLSSKEVAILTTLADVRLATASQLERLHFHEDTSRNRRRVLQSLTERGLVTRLDRTVGGKRAGSMGHIFAASVAGQKLLEPSGHPRRPAPPGQSFLAHTLQVTEVLVRLRDCERQGQIELVDFEAEPRCWRRFPGPGATQICKPDAHVRVGVGAFLDAWFLEVDRSTEGPAAIRRQLEIYRRYWASGIEQSRQGVFPRVLWLVPDERRHAALVDIIGRQPAETWQLHQVTLTDNGVATMTEGAS
jgi:hypothetical protein